MGAYFVATGISQYLGSVVANIAHIPEGLADPESSLRIYSQLFNQLGYAGIFCTLVALAMLPLMRRLESSHGAQAPAAASGAT